MLGLAGRLTRNSAANNKPNRASLVDGVATKTQQDLIWDACRFITNPIHPTIKVILKENHEMLQFKIFFICILA